MMIWVGVGLVLLRMGERGGSILRRWMMLMMLRRWWSGMVRVVVVEV